VLNPVIEHLYEESVMSGIARLLIASILAVASQFATAQTTCSTPTEGGYFPALDTSRRAVLIFVHGVLGNPVNTWLYSPVFSSDVFWPCLLLDDPLFKDKTNIYLASYTTALGASPTLETAADQLYADLRDVIARHEHVGFVVHSLGGLEVTKMLLKRTNEPDIRKIRFVHFYGTPASGSSWARFTEHFASSPAIKAIADAKMLDQLSHDWKTRSRELKIRSFCAAEQKGYPVNLPFVDPIVPAESASAVCNEPAADVYVNHVELVKPFGRDAPQYKLLASSFGNCIGPRLGTDKNVAQTAAGKDAIAYVLQMRETLRDEGQRVGGDVALLAEDLLYRTGNKTDFYTLPRNGAASLGLQQNDLSQGKPFTKEFRDQMRGRLATLRILSVVPLKHLGDAISNSDGYSFAQDRELNALFAEDDLVVIAESAAADMERVLLFVAQTTKPGEEARRLRGFAFFNERAKCV
jgi:hypothetical protein